MALVITVEDGSGVANANSYISLTDADAYFGARLYSTAWTAAITATKNIALAQSARTLDNYIQWYGIKADPDFTMQWPRVDIFERQNVDGAETDVELVDMVPQCVIDAQCELAVWLLSNDVTSVKDTAGFSELSIAGAISFKVDNTTKPLLIPALVFQLVGKYGTRKGSYPQVVRA